MLLKATKYYVSMFLLYHKIKRKEFEMIKKEKWLLIIMVVALVSLFLSGVTQDIPWPLPWP